MKGKRVSWRNRRDRGPLAEVRYIPQEGAGRPVPPPLTPQQRQQRREAKVARYIETVRGLETAVHVQRAKLALAERVAAKTTTQAGKNRMARTVQQEADALRELQLRLARYRQKLDLLLG